MAISTDSNNNNNNTYSDNEYFHHTKQMKSSNVSPSVKEEEANYKSSATKTTTTTTKTNTTTTTKSLSSCRTCGNREIINEEQITELESKGYTRGLAQSLSATKDAFRKRIWIVDNSGSMRKKDGNRIVPVRKGNDGYDPITLVPCTRWQEIQECVKYHIQLAGLINAPTTFRLLNPSHGNFVPETIKVGDHHYNNYDVNNNERQRQISRALHTIESIEPRGCTPLTDHILRIQREVKEMTPLLRENDQRVVIVIATDGLPTNSRGQSSTTELKAFVNALRSLEGYPVWIVIRLCTDDEDVVNFYNELDTSLELSIEVLDDYYAEAHEVYSCNPWLNYALPLHRLREMGYHDRVFDMLDERLLTKTELFDFCRLLFFGTTDEDEGVVVVDSNNNSNNNSKNSFPDPSLDWEGFITELERIQEKEKLQFHPIKKRMKHWISIRMLNRLYRPRSPRSKWFPLL